jgi:hypothetical protein
MTGILLPRTGDPIIAQTRTKNSLSLRLRSNFRKGRRWFSLPGSGQRNTQALQPGESRLSARGPTNSNRRQGNRFPSKKRAPQHHRRMRRALEPLEDRVVPANLFRVGPQGGSWSTASNWYPAQVPTSLDDLTFQAGGIGANTDSVVDLSLTVRSIYEVYGFTGTITLLDGVVLTSTHSASFQGGLILNGATLASSGDIWLYGAVLARRGFNTGSTLQGFDIVQDPASSLDVEGLTSTGAPTLTVIANGEFNQQGTVKVGDSFAALASMSVVGVLDIHGPGTTEVLPSNTLTQSGGSTSSYHRHRQPLQLWRGAERQREWYPFHPRRQPQSGKQRWDHQLRRGNVRERDGWELYFQQRGPLHAGQR